MKNKYLELVSLIQSAYGKYRRRIDRELELLGIDDVSNIQASLLFLIGAQQAPVIQAKIQGRYLGFNISNIIAGLVKNQYVYRERYSNDQRVNTISLTDKGLRLWHSLKEMHDRDIDLQQEAEHDLQHSIWTLRQFEEFWIEQLLEGLTSNPRPLD
jgi:DNA-binding MarR family transcriptional regulator